MDRGSDVAGFSLTAAGVTGLPFAHAARGALAAARWAAWAAACVRKKKKKLLLTNPSIVCCRDKKQFRPPLKSRMMKLDTK